MSFLALNNIRPIVALSAALLGSVISLANPFEWPGDIIYDDVAIVLGSSLGLEFASLHKDFLQKTEEYFKKTINKATTLARTKSADSETQGQQQALTQLNKAAEDLMAQEKNEEKKSAALAAFKEKLAELTHQAQARGERMVAIDGARKQYLLTKAPKKLARLEVSSYGDFFQGLIKYFQEEPKQCSLFIITEETKRVEKSLNYLPFDKWSTLESSLHNAVKFYGYFIKRSGDYCHIVMSFEKADYIGFAAYEKSVDGATIINNKKEVLKRLLMLGETLQEAHNNQLYHGRINKMSFSLSKDVWKFTGFGLVNFLNFCAGGIAPNSAGGEKFLAPESYNLRGIQDPSKLDIFAFAILIQTLMLGEKDAQLKYWNSLFDRRDWRKEILAGATPFTSYLFVEPIKPAPDSKLPRDFIDGMAIFAEKDPSKRGSLGDLVELLRRTYNNWDTPVSF
jgi:hypothetical protein